MAYELTTVLEGQMIVMNDKGKTGSFARAIAFASRDVRMAFGQAMYLKWLQNGQFRPLVNDMIDVLVPKSSQPYLLALVPSQGPVPKEAFVSLCRAIYGVIMTKGKELKGQKSFVFEFVRRIVESAESYTVDA